ncbi:MAG: solute carrier family 23 protein [Eubacteriales bacterium]|nr:solute carrier family 23 protein [Bacillota bacterium]MDY5345278.1 solute carrier family 23 protein [Eubacteriales bacterium]
MKLIYDVEDKPKFNKLLVFALQQVLAIMAATIAVPTIIGLPTQIPAAILGAGLGTIVYLLFTKFKSPVIISSSFAFLSSLGSALAFGYCGIIVGGILAGLVYVVIAIIIHFAGTSWVSKLMPPVIIGPTVALIGLSLAGSAMGDIVKASVGTAVNASYNLVALLCGLITFITVVICSTQKRFKMGRLIPFIIGIGVGYAFAAFFSIFGYTLDVDYLKIINWAPLVNNFKVLGDAAASAGDKVQAFLTYPDFALIEAIKEMVNGSTEVGKTYFFESAAGFGEVAIAFIPVALVVFAEHIADHKNLSSIINRDLVEGEPGLKRTLLGDGVGSIVGTVFGICPNTTYGESVGCVAITRNASVSTIFTAAIMCIILSFISPIMSLLETIPSCVMGGVCLTLYGFIAVSGLKMFKDIDLGENKNLFTVSAILIAGIGGLAIKIPYHIAGSDVLDKAGKVVMVAGTVDKTITITSIATALILGIITYAVINAVEKRNAKLPDDSDEIDTKENAINAPVMAESTYEVGVDVTTLGENKDEAANETKAENVENTAETVEENKD